jgi:DNA polymerase-1
MSFPRKLWGGIRVLNRASPRNVARLDNNAVPSCVRMMRNGIAVDRDALSDLVRFLDSEDKRLVESIADSTGFRINPGSSDQVAQLLFKDLALHKLATRDIRVGITKTGKISTNKFLIEQLVPYHPCVLQILEHRQAMKLKGTYALSILKHAREDKRTGDWRIHTTISTTGTDTGRLTSSEPINLQTAPQRTELGRRLKSCFIAPKGKLLIECDYSQIEMRVAAHLAQPALMLAEFAKAKADIHTQTAMKVFGLPKEEIDEQVHRYPMKRAGFLILYLGAGNALAVQLNALEAQDPARPKFWTEQECDELIEGWYQANTEIRDWQSEVAATMRRYGMIWDIFGRIRKVPEVRSSFRHIQEKGIRQGTNMPIQSTAQGLIKLAMAELHEYYNDGLRESCGVEELMQIHDALLVEADEAYAGDVAKLTREVMEGVCELQNVPVKADAKVGPRWGTPTPGDKVQWTGMGKLKEAV